MDTTRLLPYSSSRMRMRHVKVGLFVNFFLAVNAVGAQRNLSMKVRRASGEFTEEFGPRRSALPRG